MVNLNLSLVASMAACILLASSSVYARPVSSDSAILLYRRTWASAAEARGAAQQAVTDATQALHNAQDKNVQHENVGRIVQELIKAQENAAKAESTEDRKLDIIGSYAVAAAKNAKAAVVLDNQVIRPVQRAPQNKSSNLLH